MRNQVQLIAYADRLGGTLPALGQLLDGPLDGLFGGVHVLPFFSPYDGADAGFDPDDHLSVDPRLGDWDDVRRIGKSYDVVADLIVNHVSDRTTEYRDVLANGERSPYAQMFLTFDRVFPNGATEADLVAIVRPRPGLPFTPAVLGDRKRLVWTTFTNHQIDLDVDHPSARRYLSSVLRRLADNGVTMVRLDAVGYAKKTPGGSCFLTAETATFIAAISAEARALGLTVLAEVHAHHGLIADTAGKVDLIYDFGLAPLILHGLFTGDAAPLRDWLARRPRNAVTVLETHDGIGLVDAAPGRDGTPGLLTDAQMDALVTAISTNSGGASRASRVPGGGYYQVSCTAYDALGGDDRRYLLARLLQLLTPGVPQIYYVGLLAGRNVASDAADTREINRRRYAEDEVVAALEQPVVRALARLIRLRSTHPAFGGEFRLLDAAPGEIALEWAAGVERMALRAMLAEATFTLTATVAGGAVGEIALHVDGGIDALEGLDLLVATRAEAPSSTPASV